MRIGVQRFGPSRPRRPPIEVFAEARALLGEGPDDTPGLTLHLVDEKVVVTGEVRSKEDVRRLEAVRKALPEVGIGVTSPAQPAPVKPRSPSK